MARIVGLDIGSQSIKAVHIESRGRTNEHEVVAYAEERLPPAQSVGEDAMGLEERQRVALAVLKESGMLDGDIFVTGLSGADAAVRTLHFPFSDTRKIAAVLPGELESQIPFDVDDLVITWVPLDAVAGEVGDDTGETTVLVAFARKEAVEAHLALLEEFGIDPRHVEFDALALDDLHAGLFEEVHEDGPSEMPVKTPGGTVIEMGEHAMATAVAMVDIGDAHTSVCVLREGNVIAARSILRGGADATRALSREFGLSLAEAERGKSKEAFIEVLGAEAQFPEQKRISEILKKAHAPIVRELRQTFQSVVSSARTRVIKVVLTGGASQVVNLDKHLSEALNVKVERGEAIGARLAPVLPTPSDAEAALTQAQAPSAAMALGFALSALAGHKTAARVDFRTGEFAWRGGFEFIQERALPLSLWGLVIFLVLGIHGITQATLLGSQEEALLDRQVQACKTITGQEIDSASRCLAIIQEQINVRQSGGVPEHSAVDDFIELARRIPADMGVKVTDLDINAERIRLKGTAKDFEDVDKVVDVLSKGACFTNVQKGKARKIKEGVELSVTLDLDCEKARGVEVNDADILRVAATVERPTAPADAATPPVQGRNAEAAKTGLDRFNELPEAQKDDVRQKSQEKAKSRAQSREERKNRLKMIQKARQEARKKARDRLKRIRGDGTER
jgi:general secretion pathway protein L